MYKIIKNVFTQINHINTEAYFFYKLNSINWVCGYDKIIYDKRLMKNICTLMPIVQENIKNYKYQIKN